MAKRKPKNGTPQLPPKEPETAVRVDAEIPIPTAQDILEAKTLGDNIKRLTFRPQDQGEAAKIAMAAPIGIVRILLKGGIPDQWKDAMVEGIDQLTDAQARSAMLLLGCVYNIGHMRGFADGAAYQQRQQQVTR